MQHQRRQRTTLVLIGLAGCLLLGGCGQTREEKIAIKQNNRFEQPGWADQAGLALSPDAEDPTARDKRQGIGKWKQKEEPGTHGPMHPGRRSHGFGAASNK